MGVDGGEYSLCRKRGVGFGGHVCRVGFLRETALGDFRVGDAIKNGTRQSRAPLRAVARTRAPAERPVSLDDRITDCLSCRLACLAEITEGGSRHSCAAAEGSAKAGRSYSARFDFVAALFRLRGRFRDFGAAPLRIARAFCACWEADAARWRRSLRSLRSCCSCK